MATGLTQQALAVKADVSLATSSAWRGMHEPRLSTLRNSGKPLGVPVTELLE